MNEPVRYSLYRRCNTRALGGEIRKISPRPEFESNPIIPRLRQYLPLAAGGLVIEDISPHLLFRATNAPSGLVSYFLSRDTSGVRNWKLVIWSAENPDNGSTHWSVSGGSFISVLIHRPQQRETLNNSTEMVIGAYPNAYSLS